MFIYIIWLELLLDVEWVILCEWWYLWNLKILIIIISKVFIWKLIIFGIVRYYKLIYYFCFIINLFFNYV